jgi:hypothetical protein
MSDAGERETVRVMVVCCLLCKTELVCPAGEDEWGWSRSDPVKTFKADHLAHGAPNTVGAHFVYVDKKD